MAKSKTKSTRGSSSSVSQISKHAKATRKEGESWQSALSRSTMELKKKLNQ